jgi:hypothetical protein
VNSISKRPWDEETSWVEYLEDESYYDHKIDRYNVQFPSDNMSDDEIQEMLKRPAFHPYK